MMKANELRQKFLDFFKERGHAIIPSTSLIPENDPTTLFNSAGMQPLVPYLMGEKHPLGDKLVNVQKCVRTGDINEVGDNSHLTFFEMMGNWSLGSYFKKEAIEYSWEFLTDKKWLSLDSSKIAVSVFAGDDDAPCDNEAVERWLEVSGGALNGRIDYLPKNKNWWDPAGETGPCGPDTEIFYWVGSGPAPKEIEPGDLADHPNWLEIWNNVFMEYNKTFDGRYEPLKQKNVDTGMGLERTLAVLNGIDDNYKTELFWPIIEKIEELSGKKYNETPEIKKAMRIIADHIKASVFIIDDGVEPSNTGRGYVLRRLIRRARYYFDFLGAENKALGALVECVILIYKDIYKELSLKKIDETITDEESTFTLHLGFGRKFLEKIIKVENYISGENAFLLYSTYGYPFELILDVARERNIKVDIDGFEEKKKKHQELSRTASVGMFKGGLAEEGEQTAKYHTATHLLLSALRQILGDKVLQRGSNINSERLRFDFSYSEKMTPEQIKQTENLVNEKIKENLIVEMEEMSLEKAKESGAMGVFESKYGERVKVYTIKNEKTGEIFSKEICGGPHIKSTSELGHFKIIKEEASSAGVRRIKAVLE